MSNTDSPQPRRERSARYPGMPLGEAIAFCGRIDAKGLDGLPAPAVAEGLGFSNVRTNTFSSGLSSARQFGLLELSHDRYRLTPLARAILHPVDPAELPALHRRAFRTPPLYESLSGRYSGRRLPDAASLANVLYHHDGITASAKRPAAESFLASARFASLLDADGTLHLDPPAPPPLPHEEAPAAASPPDPEPTLPAPSRPHVEPAPVRIDLRLWGADDGKVIRVRAPEAITPESYERLLAALRLHVRIEGSGQSS